MGSSQHVETVPLEPDENGSIRIGASRVTLDVVAIAWQAGETPEQIVDRFPSLNLGDVYAVCTWMLRHPDDLSRYLAVSAADANRIQEVIQRAQSQAGLRARLLEWAKQKPRA